MVVKNGDLPAMPAITLIEVESNSGLKYELKTECTGLTKREMFAMAAMQGILANPYWNQHGEFDDKSVAKSAVNYANALLEELEKSK